MFKFLLSSISEEGSQWSKDGASLEESKCSPPMKSKVIEKVEREKKKETTMNEDVYKSVDIVSNLIEPPRDKDGKIQYQLMSFNTDIYQNGHDPSTARRQKNSLHCYELYPCPVDGCTFGRFAKWLEDDKIKLVLQRMLNSYRKYKIDRSNTIQLNSGQYDFDTGVKEHSVQAKKQMKRSIVVRLFREHVVLQNENHSLTNSISLSGKMEKDDIYRIS